MSWVGEEVDSDVAVLVSAGVVHACADSAEWCGEPVAWGGTADAPLFIEEYLSCTDPPGDIADETCLPSAVD